MEADRPVTPASVGRGRRRAVLVATGAVAVLVVGAGLLTSRVLADRGDRGSGRSDRHPIVRVETRIPRAVDDLVGKVADGGVGLSEPVALWQSGAGTLIYVSGVGYSSTCPPDAAARVTDDGTVTLDLVDAAQGICTADAVRVAVRVRGLARGPDLLTITDRGRTRTIPVLVVAGDGSAAGPSMCGTEPGLFCSSATPQP
jgi:hypothetical protein